jgi:hypothetical protein
VAAVLEVMLLRRIVLHPAGGWEAGDQVLPFFVAVAAVPLAWGALLLLAAQIMRSVRSVTAALLGVSALGPGFAYIAFAQYGPATPGLLLAGVVAQGIVLFVATLRFFRLPEPAQR